MLSILLGIKWEEDLYLKTLHGTEDERLRNGFYSNKTIDTRCLVEKYYKNSGKECGPD